MGLCAHLPHNVRRFMEKGRERESVEDKREVGLGGVMITWDVLTVAEMKGGIKGWMDR